MKHCAILLAILLAMLLFIPALPVEGGQDVCEFGVDGLKVIFRPLESETVGVQLFLDGGVVELDESTQGLEPFLLLTSFRGVETDDDLMSKLTRMGTSIGSDSYYDFSTAYLYSTRENFNESWEIFTDALLNPSLEEIEFMRSQLISSARQRKDSPDSSVVNLANSLLYENHPYSLELYGVEESLESITMEQLRSYNRDLFVKSRMLLVIVGDFSRSEVEHYASEAFGELPRGDYERKGVPEIESEQKLVYESLEIPNTYVRGLFRAPSMDHEDYYAAVIAMDILGDNLFEEVRTKRNMAYSVGSGLSSRRENYGVVVVSTNVPDEALSVISLEIEKMREGLLSRERIGEAVNGYITRFYMSNENALSQAYQLGLWEINGNGWEENFEFVENLRKVTPNDVRRVMRTYVEGITMAAVGGQSVSVKL